MGIFEPPNPKLYYIEAAEKPVQAVCFTLSSLLVSLLYMCCLDFAQSYFLPPKDFSKRGCGQTFFKPKVDAPLVEPKPGSKEFKNVLKRGSEQVSLIKPYRGHCWSNLIVSSIQTRSTESHVILMNGSLCPTRCLTRFAIFRNPS